LNAVTHGLSARRILAEEQAAFADALDQLTATYAPASHVEQALVARLAHLCVRSDRALRLETAAYAECIRQDGTPNWAVFERLTGTIGRYDLQIGRALVKAKHELERIQAARGDGVVEAPHAIDLNW
jgi:hypothetical protein